MSAGGWFGTLLLLALGVIFVVNRQLAEAVASWHGFSPWFAVGPFVALFVLGLLRANYREFENLEKKLDVADKAHAAAIAASPRSGPNFTFNDSEISHFGQLYGEGPPGGGGAIPMTPALLELGRRMYLLEVLAKQYFAAHPSDEAHPLRQIPKVWAEARLEEQGVTWRLAEYSVHVSPQELMKDYQP